MRGDTARLSGGVAPVNPHQEGAALHGPPLPRRSGSEKRKRSVCLAVRLTAEERALIEGQAERAGLATGSYARLVLLGAPPPRQIRRPPVERRELARLLGEIGHIGGNLNQLAHHANSGLAFDRVAFRSAVAALEAIRKAILSALGRSP